MYGVTYSFAPQVSPELHDTKTKQKRKKANANGQNNERKQRTKKVPKKTRKKTLQEMLQDGHRKNGELEKMSARHEQENKEIEQEWRALEKRAYNEKERADFFKKESKVCGRHEHEFQVFLETLNS